MRVLYLLIALILSVICSIYIARRKIELIKKIIYISLIVCLFFLSGTIINLNTLNPKVEKTILEIQKTFGDSETKVKGSHVYVKINNKWVDVERLEIVGNFARDYRVKLDGEEIYLSSPGIRYTIKTLKNIEFIK